MDVSIPNLSCNVQIFGDREWTIQSLLCLLNPKLPRLFDGGSFDINSCKRAKSNEMGGSRDVVHGQKINLIRWRFVFLNQRDFQGIHCCNGHSQSFPKTTSWKIGMSTVLCRHTSEIFLSPIAMKFWFPIITSALQVLFCFWGLVGPNSFFYWRTFWLGLKGQKNDRVTKLECCL